MLLLEGANSIGTCPLLFLLECSFQSRSQQKETVSKPQLRRIKRNGQSEDNYNMKERPASQRTARRVDDTYIPVYVTSTADGPQGVRPA